MKEIQKMYSKQLKKKKETKKYVVNKSFSAPQGKMKSVRGVKVVDSRMRADKRSKGIKKKKGAKKEQKPPPRQKTPKGGKKNMTK